MLRRGLVIALALSTVTPALAQPAPVPADKKAKTAKQYVDAGLAAQDTGDYDTAITFYQKAYDLVPHPVLLFNMAQAHRLAGRMDKAVELYKKYLATAPSGAQAKTAKELVDDYTTKQAAADEQKRKDAAKQAAIDAEKQKQQEATTRRAREEAAHVATERAASPPPPQPPPASAHAEPEVRDHGRPLRLTGIAMAGVGVVGIAVGIGFGVHASTLSSDLSVHGAQFDPEKVADGQAADRNMIIGLGIGGALIVGGVVLYVTHRSRPADEIALAPLVLRDGGGLAVGGRFR